MSSHDTHHDPHAPQDQGHCGHGHDGHQGGDHHGGHHAPFTPAPWPPGEVPPTQQWSMAKLQEMNSIFEPEEVPGPKQFFYAAIYITEVCLIWWMGLNLFY